MSQELPANDSRVSRSISMENTETNNGQFSFKKCPRDILRLIFEAAVTRDEQGFKTATILSHVSRHWRIIAFSTPALWIYVSFSTLKPLDATKEFLQKTCERIRGREVCLVVKDLLWEEIQSLRHLDLEHITNIGWLRLQVAGRPSPNADPLSKLLNLSGINLTKLDLIFISDSQTPRADMCVIPPLFPNLRRLRIDSGLVFVVHFGATHNAIRELCFCGVGFNFRNLVESFPELEVLELESTVSILYTEPKPKFLHLKRLRIHRSALAGCLDFILCPALAELWCDEFFRLDNILIFIEKHPSIINLTLKVASHIQQMADAAPQLQHLTICGLPKKFYSLTLDEKPLFPHLQTLTINDSEFESLEEFEALIRSRCLPGGHPKGELLLGCSPFELLGVVLLEKERLEDTIFAQSELVKESKVWVEEDEAWDSGKKVCMSWES